jgi:hypothetical protein
VWPCSVEVFDVFLDYAMKVPVPDNQQVIKAFSPQAPHPRNRSQTALAFGARQGVFSLP